MKPMSQIINASCYIKPTVQLDQVHRHTRESDFDGDYGDESDKSEDIDEDQNESED